MSGILAYVEFGILTEVSEKLDFSYFLSLHLVSGMLYMASWAVIQTSYSKVRTPRNQGKKWLSLQFLDMDLAYH